MAQLTISELQQSLRSSLPENAQQRPQAEQAKLVEAAMAELTRQLGAAPDFERRIDDALLDSTRAYAIPDDDLKLFPSVVQAVLDTFTSGPIGALSELVGALLRYRSARVELNAEEAAVLRALREAKTEGSPPLAPADVRDRLMSKGLVLQRPLSDVLAGLAQKKTEKATLVRETNGRWAIGNV